MFPEANPNDPIDKEFLRAARFLYEPQSPENIRGMKLYKNGQI